MFRKKRKRKKRNPSVSSLAEVLDRILDKGIVIGAWARDLENFA